MVGCLYKIRAKLLTSRLKAVMDSLIGPLQSSFIEGRQILDDTFITDELIIDTCQKKRVTASLLKLNFHTAFDSISWKFLDWTLEQMKFPPLWRDWINTCFMSASTSILPNGSPTKPFQRGLRQGDPLSPFLFVLVVQSLNY